MIYVITGAPLHGKTTLAKLLETQTGVTAVDVDELRAQMFGVPEPLNDTNRAAQRRQVADAYNRLLDLAKEAITQGQSLIITASFIRGERMRLLEELVEQSPEHCLVFRLEPTSLTDEEIQKRLNVRQADPGYAGGMSTYEEYKKTLGLVEPLKVAHRIIDTSCTIQESLSQLLEVIPERAESAAQSRELNRLNR